MLKVLKSKDLHLQLVSAVVPILEALDWDKDTTRVIGELNLQFFLLPASDTKEEHCRAMLGFIQWSQKNKQTPSFIICTIMSDMGGIVNDTKDFHPRTPRYSKYLEIMPEPEKCPYCKGLGAYVPVGYDQMKFCGRCEGTGKIKY